MNLDRGLIKQQARALIKDKVMKLFITSFVVSIAIMAIGGLSFSITSTSSNDIFNGSDYSFSDNGNSNDKNYFNDFDGSGKFRTRKNAYFRAAKSRIKHIERAFLSAYDRSDFVITAFGFTELVLC